MKWAREVILPYIWLHRQIASYHFGVNLSESSILCLFTSQNNWSSQKALHLNSTVYETVALTDYAIGQYWCSYSELNRELLITKQVLYHLTIQAIWWVLMWSPHIYYFPSTYLALCVSGCRKYIFVSLWGL